MDAADKVPPGRDRITFCCCVEYGGLEEGTIRLVESLRRYGGELADAKVVAVTPRPGAPLRQSTLRRFDELGVDYVKVAPDNRYSWMSYLNKYFALKEAEHRASGDLVAWMDSDVLVTAPPVDLLLDEGTDIAACPRDKNVGTTGADDENEPYWRQVADNLGVALDDLPWVHTLADGQDVRLYWNAGIFVYRPATGFADAWRRNIEKVLDGTDASTLKRVFWTDQIALGITAVQQGLSVGQLNAPMNYGIASHFKDHLSAEGLAATVLLHYHDCMTPQLWPWFMEQIAEPLPQVHRWLAQLGPVQPDQDRRRHLMRDGYRAARNAQRRWWSRAHGGGLFGS